MFRQTILTFNIANTTVRSSCIGLTKITMLSAYMETRLLIGFGRGFKISQFSTCWITTLRTSTTRMKSIDDSGSPLRQPLAWQILLSDMSLLCKLPLPPLASISMHAFFSYDSSSIPRVTVSTLHYGN